MTDIVHIPLNKLEPSADNVRKTNRKFGIGELAASIEAHGLLQSLVVTPLEDERYAVVAGGRRLAALKLLVKGKALEKDAAIPCRVLDAADGAEASLAENAVREAMHPADEIAAFAKLVEDGCGPEAIAARFGVTPAVVARRLKLARVSPRIIAAFKRDEVSMDQMAALALTDDHRLQEEAFFKAEAWARTPDRLRATVTSEHMAESDKLVRFVGLEAYEAAGGRFLTDLFMDEDAECWLTDRDVLDKLAAEKLQAIAGPIREEGWGFVEVLPDGFAWNLYPERIGPKPKKLSKKDQARQEELLEALDACGDEGEQEAIEAEIDALNGADWNIDEMALAGAVVTLTPHGGVQVHRGLVRADDVKAIRKLRKAEMPAASGTPEAQADPRTTGLSGKLRAELIAHKTLALRAELANQPDLALRVLAHALAHRAFYAPWDAALCLSIRVEEVDLERRIQRQTSPAVRKLKALEASWRKRLPKEADDLWPWISDAGQDVLLSLLAFLITPGLDLDVKDCALAEGVTQVAGLSMAAWWKPTVDGYFAHVPRALILDAMSEVNGELGPGFAKMAKPELLDRAKKAFRKTTWLPPLLRNDAAMEAEAVAVAAE